MKPRKGFTFIELILAIVLFSFGIVSVIQIFPVNRRLITQSSMQTQASYLAQEQMEKVRAVAYADLDAGTYEARAALPAGAGTFATQFERGTVVTLIDGNRAATGIDVGLKKVVVTVYWTENNVNRTYVLSSYANNL
ncbi:MAG TPA: prepilin-type N-terminal cleavage/methylation domain-containing protein [Verrucomicrobiae bacterium]|nr:prepilin-type N-terminal cleavage/methylation domain-containing protein [Verrucomicrobiae bacterium]